jgi:GNAT superfamily N-acetyltransferase
VEYFRERQDEDDDNECKIGPYSFDCVIPSTPKKLLIECQGDYWHSLDVIKSRDKAKAAYITNNLANEYEIRYIWEHEFKNLNKVQELLKYWLGLSTPEICDFSFNDVTIAKAEASDYKLLLSKYHYLANAGRGGISIGGYVDGELACVAVFSPLPRQNITIGEYKASEVRDLSRFCINPKYQKKNFGTWFLSRAIKMLSPEYRCIVAYADTTFNHSGAIYKAANFTLDKVVRPDYWYVSEDGWVMHKKTLYNHAVSLGMIESEFAAENEYTKVWGKEKLRFVFNR